MMKREREFNPQLFWATIIGICLVIVMGSVFVTRSYMKRRNYEAANPRLPFLSKLEKDLKGVNRDGKDIHLAQLKGKVWVAGYLYTDCPSACLGLAAYMADVNKLYGKNENFHLVSISLNPKGDTPEKMDAFVKKNGVDADNWWFLSGDEEEVRKYMLRYFKLYSVKENTETEAIASNGQFSHDQRLVLVDKGGNIRGYYRVMDAQRGSQELLRLKADVKRLLDGDEGVK
ncbi:MAG: SCO family protein [Verrucomicrobiales bacterium]|nr:SCO family protein [Verrucomicrobiales bacterium]